MAKSRGLPEVVAEIYPLLEPFESDDRQKIIGSVMMLLGEDAKVGKGAGTKEEERESTEFGAKTKRWMQQNGISSEMIEEVFHRADGAVEVIANEIPGNGKRLQTRNCYLLSGVCGLLAGDEARFTEAQVVALCKSIGCFDSPNHAKTRGELGNIVAGTKANGFTLPAPGLREAAELIKQMAK